MRGIRAALRIKRHSERHRKIIAYSVDDVRSNHVGISVVAFSIISCYLRKEGLFADQSLTETDQGGNLREKRNREIPDWKKLCLLFFTSEKKEGQTQPREDRNKPKLFEKLVSGFAANYLDRKSVV